MKTIPLDVLDRIEIAAPCPARWEDMRGDDRSRWCAQCRLNVYNIAAMTREEASALILAKEGRLCARIYRRADGTILTRDCPVGLHALRRRAALAIGRLAAAVAFLLGGGLIGAARGQARARELEPFGAICRWLAPGAPPARFQTVTIGDMCITPPSPAPPAPAAGGH